MSTIYSRVGGVGSAPSSRLTAGYLHTCSVKERRAGGGSEVECMELKLHFTAVGPSRPLILFKEVLSFNLSWTDEAGSSDLTGGSWIHGRRVWDLLSDITSASRLTCWGWDALKSHSSSRRWRESLRLAERVPEAMRLTVLETTLISCCIFTRRNSETVFWFCVIKQFHQFKSFLLLVSFLLWCRQKHQTISGSLIWVQIPTDGVYLLIISRPACVRLCFIRRTHQIHHIGHFVCFSWWKSCKSACWRSWKQ